MSNEFVQTSSGKAKSIRNCITSRTVGLERKPMRFALWLTGRCDNRHPESETASQLDQTCSRGCDEEIACTMFRDNRWTPADYVNSPLPHAIPRRSATASNSRRVWKRKTETPATIQFRDKHNSESWKRVSRSKLIIISYQISWDFPKHTVFARNLICCATCFSLTRAACWIRRPIT